MKQFLQPCFFVLVFLSANDILAQKSNQQIDSLNSGTLFQKHLRNLTKDSLGLNLQSNLNSATSNFKWNDSILMITEKDTILIFEPKRHHATPVIKPQGKYTMPVYGSGSIKEDGYELVNPVEKISPVTTTFDIEMIEE